MIDTLSITNILFLDVETVSGKEKFEELNEEMRYLWKLKAAQISRTPAAELDEETCAALYSDKAAIYAEFGKIVCISVGLIVKENDEYHIRLKSFKGYDEAALLAEFAELMNQYFNDSSKHFLCGHNLIEFDVPYICRRMVIHGIKHPSLLQLHGKKPWETKYLLDTMTLWKFGDYKHYSSLKLLTGILIYSEVEMLNDSQADWVHVDVMDGSFVPNISFGFPVIEAIKSVSKLPLDVHLMIDNPERYIRYQRLKNFVR